MLHSTLSKTDQQRFASAEIQFVGEEPCDMWYQNFHWNVNQLSPWATGISVCQCNSLSLYAETFCLTMAKKPQEKRLTEHGRGI